MTLLFIGTTEIIVIAAIILLIFGGKKLPELMRGFGKGMKEFKDGMREVDKPEEQQAEETQTENKPLDK